MSKIITAASSAKTRSAYRLLRIVEQFDELLNEIPNTAKKDQFFMDEFNETRDKLVKLYEFVS